jgi:hypothetical protein
MTKPAASYIWALVIGSMIENYDLHGNRIERSGPVDPLTPRVERFIREALCGQSLDEMQSANELRADYVCLRGLVAIELKTLEDDGQERVDNLLDQLRQRPDWPIFLGSAPLQSFIQNTDDPDELGKRVLERIGRGITRPLQKANRQLEAHQTNFPRPNLVKLLVLVNEDHQAYDPHTVSYLLWHAVRREDAADQPRFAHVDAIIYFTERHATVVENLLTFPITIVEGAGVYDAPWKSEVIDFVERRWIKFCGYPDLSSKPDLSEFSTIDHIPEEAPRHERWRTDYSRNSYMKSLSNEQLQEVFDEIMLLSTLSFLKDPPIRIEKTNTTEVMECFTHMMQEMGDRAIPVTEFEHSPERDVAAARRLELPKSVDAWIWEIEATKQR